MEVTEPARPGQRYTIMGGVYDGKSVYFNGTGFCRGDLVKLPIVQIGDKHNLIIDYADYYLEYIYIDLYEGDRKYLVFLLAQSLTYADALQKLLIRYGNIEGEAYSVC